MQNIGLTLQNSLTLIKIMKYQLFVWIILSMAETMTFHWWLNALGVWHIFPYIRLGINILIIIFYGLLFRFYLLVKKCKNYRELKIQNLSY
jgi:hypothetical protein